MKLLFLFGNIIALFGVIVLAYMNISFKPSPPDSVLKNTPAPENFNNIKIEKTLKKQDENFSILWEDNIFSPFRAKENGDNFTAKSNNFELLGIILYGESSGAIIIDKGDSASFQNSNKGLNEMQSITQSKVPQFYKLNETLPNGFFIKEINNDSVVLVRGKEQIILQLDFDDEGSKIRINEALKISSSYPSQQQEGIKLKEQSQNNVIIYPSQEKTLHPQSDQQKEDKVDVENKKSEEENSTQNINTLKHINKSLRKPGEISK